MPEPVRAAWQRYWRAWLIPHMKTEDLVQGYVGQEWFQKWYDQTNDWRGNFSVYRTYAQAMGTMNFNHWGTAGVLFGGSIIGDEYLMAQGREGMENLLLRLWSWFDGSTQESIDHYYFSMSLIAQKLFADLGPTGYDRMLGRSLIAKGVSELSSLYHPHLRRFVSPSGRTGIAYLLAQQDGLQHVLHTLSPEGTLTDTKRQEIGGLEVYGHDLLPGVVGQSALEGAWGPRWLSHVIDEKPLPFSSTMTFKQWGSFSDPPLYRRSYMSNHYGLASQDLDVANTVPVMAQWRRTDEKVTSATDLGTLTVRFGINQTNVLDTYHAIFDAEGQPAGQNPNGILGAEGGFLTTLQDENRALVLSAAFGDLHRDNYDNNTTDDTVRSLQTTIAVTTLQPEGPTWKLYLDGKPIDRLPVEARAGQRIVIADGVALVGILPLESTDLGRDVEIRITDQTGEPVRMQGGGKLRPSLLIEQYLYRSDTPLPNSLRGSKRLDQAHGGFVIEMGDTDAFATAEAFDAHLQQADARSRFDAAEGVVQAGYRSDGREMELRFKPEYNAKGGTREGLLERTIDGTWAYLPEQMDRDTTVSQMGRTGQLEKNGAMLATTPGLMAFLVHEPVSGTVAAYNPLPDANDFALTLPGGGTVRADGKVGLLNVEVREADGAVTVEHAFNPDRPRPDGAATRLLLGGFSGEVQATLNGGDARPLPTEPGDDGRPVHVLELVD